MRLATRLIIVVCFGLALALFAQAPALLAYDQVRIMELTGLAQLGGPIAAAVACLLAAWRGRGGDRAAWLNFGIGSLLYLAGNLGYAYFSVAGVSPTFPAAPELAYFVMALFFASGMFQYAKVRNRLSRVQLYNFVLIYCAVTLGSLFTLSHSLAESVLSPFGTIAAFLYPALWFSVASTGLISLLLYDQGRKSLPLALLVLAVLAESIADYSYALELMEGTYRLGGLSQLLWVASAGLIAWAALEHIALARQANAEPKETRRRSDRGIAQAAVPALAVATILLAGSFTGALGSGAYVWLSAVLGAGFAIIAGFREHWIIHTQRQLRSVVEGSKADLEKSQERIRSVLESTSDSVLVLDHDWKLVYYNERALETIKQPGGLELGASIWKLFPSASAAQAGEHYRRAVETREPAEFELFAPDRGVWLGINAYPTPDGLSIFFRDISEQRRAREEMTHMAHHDPLTGLGNRLQFQETLEQATRSGQSVATLVLDLDHFKEVNDTLGHPVGDAVLIETARRLRASVRPQDTIARLGGDEFAVIVTGYSGRTELLRLAQGLLDAAMEPHHIDGLTVSVGASAGIALSVPGKDDANRLFKNADIALYVAKAEARGSYCFFEPAMEVGMQQRQALRADLAAALDRQQFELAFQPLVDLHTGRVASFETLLRWRHPELGMIAPDVFIPLAEESGLMIGIGDWVLRQACIEAQNWPAEISLAVNLSTKQFGDDGLADTIAATLEFTGLACERLELEITESVLLKDNKTNLLTLNRLRDMGIRIALDDFGTGYSSLGYLQRFPFSKIKIDRSFISGLPDSDESQAIVRSVIGLGKSLGMKVTAEGVETIAQLDWVKGGCDEAQGYLLSRPIPASDIPALIARINGEAGQRRAS
jgi:diguanylate cyclase (GGDEF)-like protein